MILRTGSLVLIAVVLTSSVCFQADARASEPSFSSETDGTNLLFVGENVDVLSIASRREESAAKAPAVAQVVSRREFQQWGSVTLSQVLERVAGFYMADKKYGSMPFLRGLPNSVLFLYDTVPLSSDLSKTLHPLDHELSLAPVKRVEIVRGPASVLWGPDAFGGVVNVVPLTGQDIQGVEVGTLLEQPDEHVGAYLNLGRNEGTWDGFLSFSTRSGKKELDKVNIVRFWGDRTDGPLGPAERMGQLGPDRSYFVDLYGHVSYGDLLALSGRFSQNSKPYAVTSLDQKEVWRENRRLPFGFVKLDARRPWGLDTVVRFTGFYSFLQPELEVIDRTLKQKEETFYAEALMERTLWTGQGLFTGGLSLKRKKVKDAPVWDSYFPDFLGPDNLSFLPDVTFQDFGNTLWSIFAQYIHKLGNFDLMAGLRYDLHDELEDHVSFSAGIVWSPVDEWLLKLLYGTSYRTPFARQLLEEGHAHLEKAENASLQVVWSPDSRASIGVTGFFTRIANHTLEDPYAGLSEPNRQKITGIEVEGRFKPFDTLECVANLTLLDNHGPLETFRFTEFSFLTPEGELVEETTELRYPFDTGPQKIFNAGVYWRPNPSFSIFGGLRYFAERRLVQPRQGQTEKVPETWLLDLNVALNNLWAENLDISLSIRNLLDQNHETPGTFSLIEGEPLKTQLVIRYHW